VCEIFFVEIIKILKTIFSIEYIKVWISYPTVILWISWSFRREIRKFLEKLESVKGLGVEAQISKPQEKIVTRIKN